MEIIIGAIKYYPRSFTGCKPRTDRVIFDNHDISCGLTLLDNEIPAFWMHRGDSSEMISILDYCDDQLKSELNKTITGECEYQFDLTTLNLKVGSRQIPMTVIDHNRFSNYRDFIM